MKSFAVVFAFAVFSIWASAQQTVNWTEYVTAKEHLRLSLPGDTLFVKKARGWQLLVSLDNAAISVEKNEPEGWNPRESVQKLDFKKEDKKNYKETVLGDFLVRSIEAEDEQMHSISIHAGSKRYYYRISIKAPPGKNPVFETLINSIRIEGKSIVTSAIESTKDQNAVLIEDLKSSPTVESALTMKCKDTMNYGFAPADFDLKPIKTKLYSRELVLITKPLLQIKGAFSGSGSVRLRVIFGAEGCVIGALVVKYSNKDAVQAALRAAAQIRFLPAQIGGKSVETYKTFEYSYDSGYR